jgi:NADH:ubiquinone oxidoreductase subunit 3 (subunit A)
VRQFSDFSVLRPKVVVFVVMSSFLRSFLTVVWFGLAAVLIASLLLWVASLLRPVKPTREKQLTYESGVDPVGEGWSQSQVRYYIFALLFVIFDVEAVFIFPWATQLERYAGFGLVEMGIFVFVLLLGLVYAWRKGVLRWV